MDDLIGQDFGRYRIIEQIGQGGMATVYKAYQPGLDRTVAVKVLPPVHAKQPGFSERFDREAKAIASLNHPNILPVFDSGQHNDYSFLVMRYVDQATTLKAVMERDPNLNQIISLINQVASALDYAHQKGVVHRDVKPGNILMDGDWALLTDFGLAKMTEASVKLTGTGVGIGTPAYMSPEQGQGQAVDHRTDIYALGVILFEMLTGQIPHDAETPFAIVLKRISEPLPLPRSINPDIPPAVERVVLKALAADPNDRFQNAGELAQALQQAATANETQAHPDASTTKLATPAKTGPAKRKTLWLVPFVVIGGALLLLILFVGLGLGTFFLSQTNDQTIGKNDPEPTSTVNAPATTSATPVPQTGAGPVVTATEPAALAPQPTATPPIQMIYKVKEGVSESLYATTLGVDGAELLASGANTTISSISPDKTRIIVRLKQDDKYSLYLINVDGTNRHPLITDMDYASARFSRDVDKIRLDWREDDAYSLMVLAGDGSHPVTLVNGASSYISSSWLPDWQEIALSVKQGETYTLYVVNGDGSERKRITSGASGSYYPKLLANGRRLAYIVDDGETERIILANSDGSQNKTIFGPADDVWLSQVSPQTGKKFLAEIEETAESDDTLYLVDALNGQKQRLVSGEYVSGRFSPDELWIMATVQKNDSDYLYLISTDGAEQHQVLGPHEDAYWRTYASDAPWIMAVTEDNGIHRLYLVGTDGTSVKEFIGANEHADWYLNGYFSSDGQRVMVREGFKEPCCTTSLYVMNLDGSGRVMLAENAAWQVSGSFLPDNRQIIFDSNRDGGQSIYLARADGSNIRKLIDGYAPYLIPGSPRIMAIYATPRPTATPTPTAEPSAAE